MSIGSVDPDIVTAALKALALDGVSVRESAHEVPAKPGLYALKANAHTWELLGLGLPPDGRPLYVGKAEDSLGTRDVKTHFGTGRTGSSTVRRTIGALLADQLDLVAQPRNPAKPGYFSNYGFELAGDARLTEWMLDHLKLATWVPPSEVVLDEIETEVVQTLGPPLNVAKVRTPWGSAVSAARKRQAAAARRWAT
ncbi:MAG: GIY-YIG nuclease family protein [Acidimicrobiales bacterium]